MKDKVCITVTIQLARQINEGYVRRQYKRDAWLVKLPSGSLILVERRKKTWLVLVYVSIYIPIWVCSETAFLKSGLQGYSLWEDY